MPTPIELQPGADLVVAGIADLADASENGDGAHARYNALIRRLVSFERARACVG